MIDELPIHKKAAVFVGRVSPQDHGAPCRAGAFNRYPVRFCGGVFFRGCILNAAAMQAMQQCRAVLKMDSSPLRFEWVAKYRGAWESDLMVMRRRRELLRAAGVHFSNQGLDWDDLPDVVREKLNAAHLG